LSAMAQTSELASARADCAYTNGAFDPRQSQQLSERIGRIEVAVGRGDDGASSSPAPVVKELLFELCQGTGRDERNRKDQLRRTAQFVADCPQHRVVVLICNKNWLKMFSDARCIEKAEDRIRA